MSTDLIAIERTDALTVFTQPEQLDPILQRIASEVRAFVPDTSTAKGRREIASMAHRVAQSKVYLDDLGKELVAEYKELPRKIDASRKAARDFLDGLKAEVRAPLDAWESEQARIQAAEAAAAEAERLRIQIEHDYEVAVLMNAEFDRQRAEQRRLAEQIAKEHERIAVEAAQRRERELAEQRIIEARLATERAEQARKDAEARADRERAEAEERAQRAAREAVEAERRRAEEAARVEAEKVAAREADQAHRKAINRAVLAGLVSAGLTEEQGKAVVRAVVEGRVPHISIHY